MMKVLLLLGLVAVALCEPTHYVGDKVFRLWPVSDTHISFIKELESNVKVDFWSPDSADLVAVHTDVDIHIPASYIDMVSVMLQQSGMEYQVLIEDVQTAVRQQFDNIRQTKAHDYMKYNSWENVEAWVNSITSSNPALISRSTLGKSYEGRSMHLLKIGKNTGSTKPAIFMDCGIHAREWISPAFCQWFVQEAVSTYGSDPQMTSLLNKMDIFVLPVFNVDGYAHTWKSDRMWRKTRSRKTGSSCIGADPNRNFDAGWCNQAFVTLATNDKYAKGAVVLGKSLRNHKTSKKLVVLIGPHVSEPSRAVLQTLYDEVRLVDVLDSGDTAHLAMMQRPDLGVTFTKLHCWTLTHYSKCVFMDADTMAVANIDELFDREELSAAPDPGWPDCFNSGVFVFCPSNETYGKLLQYCTEHGSFDGGDQGVLNGYFSDWATSDIRKHLPFIYNMSSIAIYTYLPAFKQYGSNAKVVHFLGKTKPWSYTYDPNQRRVQGDVQEASSHPGYLLEWWSLYSSCVLPLKQQQELADQPSEFTVQEEFQPQALPGLPPLSSAERKQRWEQGQADYMGMDSFDNIEKKLSAFLK
ncbi:hypothetical protein HF521_018014 [Silurus meridionalis]|uniref:glycogenin glucosyltransferase n=1 Tax=Silurus meridionalis TaxID=175797 RepID=A0A8T0BTW5_SILME|nr:hypothetical protein HF521_018014 [Silurus meridionalis]